jgi:hypothetical protein
MAIKNKRMIMCLSLTCFFVAGSQVQAGSSWNNLKDWVAGKWNSYSDNNSEWITKDIFSKQLQETDNSHHSLELEEFINSTTSSSKRKIELQQQTYLQQLTQAKNQLNQHPLGTYYEERQVKLDAELTQELEQYLAELLGEKQ